MIRRGRASLLLLALAGCAAPPRRPPLLAPPPPPPLLRPPPPVLAWLDAAPTAGRWRYEQAADGSRAAFGDGALVLQCLAGERRLVLRRADAAAATPLTVTTTYGTRILPAAAGAATLPARDPLWDQLAFSRGRFAVEAAGLPRLILPAWAEPARVIEDCRAGGGPAPAPPR